MKIKFGSALANEIIEFITKEKNVKIPKEKMSDFEKLAKSLEESLNKDLEEAVEKAIKEELHSFRGKLASMNVPEGFAMSYDYADRILGKSNIKML